MGAKKHTPKCPKTRKGPPEASTGCTPKAPPEPAPSQSKAASPAPAQWKSHRNNAPEENVEFAPVQWKHSYAKDEDWNNREDEKKDDEEWNNDNEDDWNKEDDENDYNDEDWNDEDEN